MEVYIVVYGDESSIECVFATKELAQEYIASKRYSHKYEIQVYKVLRSLEERA